jgi:hypothetical protein
MNTTTNQTGLNKTVVANITGQGIVEGQTYTMIEYNRTEVPPFGCITDATVIDSDGNTIRIGNAHLMLKI